MDPEPNRPRVNTRAMPTIVIDPAERIQISTCDSPEPSPAPKADSLAASPDTHLEAFPAVDSTRQHLEAASPSTHHTSALSVETLRDCSAQRQRQDSLTIPDISSTASLDSSLPSPSSNGGDMATLRPTASNGASWTSSRVTLPTGDEAERLLLPKSHDGGPGPFAFTADGLARMFDPRSVELFRDAGGLSGLAKGLGTDLSAGLSQAESFDETTGYGSTSWHVSTGRAAAKPFTERIAVFGENRLPERQSKSLIQLMLIALSDRVLLLLFVVSIISLALGLYQALCQPHAPGQPRVEWVEGVTILTAVAIAVVVGSIIEYQKERQFVKLNRKRDDRVIKVTRSGKSMEISVYGVMVGDVLHLAPGDVAPADGILISSYNVRSDESSLTGETHLIKKTSGNDVMDRIDSGHSADDLDPFIISGSQTLEGVGTYLATCVGTHSTHGRLIMSLNEDPEPTNLQKKLGVVADQIAKVGITVAVLLFVILFMKFLTQLPTSHSSPYEKGQAFLRIIIVSITVVVVAVPEGLPLAVTLALAIAVIRMLKDNNLVRILASCETMSNATTICCDKTGTLTMNEMKVTSGVIGTTLRFGYTEDANQESSAPKTTAVAPKTISIANFFDSISSEVRDLLIQSIIINSTAFETYSNGKTTFVGSKTESALLALAKERIGVGPIDHERANAREVQVIPFDSSRKYMATVTQLSWNKFRVYVKGAPETLLEKSNQVLRTVTTAIKTMPLTKDLSDMFTNSLDEYANHALRTIGFAFRDLEAWPPRGARFLESDSDAIVFDDIFHDMVMIGITGIRDPLRPGVTEAVAKSQHAGVNVKMVTGDNIGTAKAIATECGILKSNGLALEGLEFRQLSTAEIDAILPRLQVLARSTPEDKKILVQRLKVLGEVVAVTGDGTNDGPALRAADVGFSMGISGTEVAKESASIILLDDNFSSIVKAIEWSRTVNDAIRKFLQFQITVNITAVTLTFVSAIASDTEESILTPVQLLWVNLIMDTFAALALATIPPNPIVLERTPEPKNAPLMTLDMWKMVVGQSIYQLIIVLTLNFAGNQILGYKTPFERSRLETVVFNSFVWMQFFNQYNNRRLDNHFNVFSGLHRNWYFIGVNLITIVGQVLIINFGGSALSAMRLDATQWAISIGLGAMSLIVGVAIRLVPNSWFKGRGRWAYEPISPEGEV